jgi:transposase-like protein
MAIFALSSRQRRQFERQLKTAGDVRVYRRTLALLEYDRERSVTEIARSLRVSRPSIYRWIERNHEAGDPKSLLDDERP